MKIDGLKLRFWMVAICIIGFLPALCQAVALRGGLGVAFLQCGGDGVSPCNGTDDCLVSKFDAYPSDTTSIVVGETECAKAVAELNKGGGNCSTSPSFTPEKYSATCDFAVEDQEPAQIAVVVIFFCSQVDGTFEVSSDAYTSDNNGGDPVFKLNGAMPRMLPEAGYDCAAAIKEVIGQGGNCSVAPAPSGYSATCDYTANNVSEQAAQPEIVLFTCEDDNNGSYTVNALSTTNGAANGIEVGTTSCAEAVGMITFPGGSCSVMPTSSGAGKSASCDLQAPHPFDN